MKKIKFLLSTLLILVLFSMISCSSGPNFSYEDTKLNQKLTINFETNGGTSKESKTFESGTDVSEIVDYLNNVPTKESAEFYNWEGLQYFLAHWYADGDHGWSSTSGDLPSYGHVCSDYCCYRVSPGFQKETITLVALWKTNSPSIIIKNSNLDFSLDTANNVKPYYIFSSDEYSKVDYGNLYFVNSEGEKLSSRIIKDGYFCDFFNNINYYPGDIDFVCTPNFKPAKNITFESNGGTACEKMIFGESFDIKELPTPTKENYCFVGKSAFANCSELTSIKLPDSVLTIGSSAFKECKKLTNVTLPKWIEILPSSIFSNCSVLKSISIPNAVENIEDNAFLGCIALESIVIPENVITLGSSAFSGCEALTTVKLNDKIESIEDSTFYNAKKLCSITGVSKIRSITQSAFAGCASLVTIENLQMLESIEQQAFKDCIVFETITLPTCFESIGREAFFNCKALKQFLLPENVSSIGESAFISCVSLEKINISSKVKTLSAHVFYQCTSLISITIDEGVETILDRAFFECKKLQSIVLPSSLKVIDTSVFLNCTSLKAITIPEKVYKIGNGIIVGCSSISSVEFKNTTDWYSTENPNYKGGETFDTSNTSKNVSSLKNEKLFLYNSVLKDLEDQTNNVYSCFDFGSTMLEKPKHR